MTRNEILRRFPAASEDTIRRNLGDSQANGIAVRGLETDSSKSASLPALDGGQPVKPRRPRRVGRGHGPAQIRVLLVACRHRLTDPDSCSFSMKAVTDAVAAELGLDDADPRVVWEWQQCETRGEEGVIVKIDQL